MEKKQSLDDFIDKNRALFDDNAPSAELWDRISEQIPGNKSYWQSKSIKYSLLKIAAVVIFISIIPAIWYSLLRSQGEQQSALSGEISEISYYYESQIEAKRMRVSQLTADEPSINTEVDADLAQLEKILSDLKEDLNDDVANREVVSAMIQNYRMKLDILEQVLEYIDYDDNSSKKQDDYEEIQL
jgi:hypothetical protein